MAGETQITICGNLTAPPELRYTQSGAPVASFTVASTPRTFDKAKNEFVDGDTLFMRCSAWRELAENIAETFPDKGARVIVQGRLVQRSYEDRDGQKRTVVELQVDEIGPSLKYASAKVTRAQRSGNGGGFAGGAPSGQGDPWAGSAPAGGFSETPPF